MVADKKSTNMLYPKIEVQEILPQFKIFYDQQKVYLNSLRSGSPERGMLYINLMTEKEVVLFALFMNAIDRSINLNYLHYTSENLALFRTTYLQLAWWMSLADLVMNLRRIGVFEFSSSDYRELGEVSSLMFSFRCEYPAPKAP